MIKVTTGRCYVELFKIYFSMLPKIINVYVQICTNIFQVLNYTCKHLNKYIKESLKCLELLCLLL